MYLGRNRARCYSQADMQAHLYFKPRPLQIGELKDACEEAVGEVLGPDFTIKVEYPRRPSPGVRDSVMLNAESLRPVVDLTATDFPLEALANASRPYRS